MNGNEIVKTALLGTDKYMPQAPPALGETGAKIMARPTDKEDRFLKLAIATLLYEEAGQKPIHVERVVHECPAELFPAITDDMSSKIKLSLSMKDAVVFQYFIYLVNKKNRVLTADLVPAVLNEALQQKKGYWPLIKAAGETGKWLCILNPDWRPLLHETDDENVWETGSIDARKTYLTSIRARDQAKAIELLENTIEKESAANRASLLEVLHTNLSLNDEPFLQKLQNDKSQKVKDMVVGMLQKLQGSVINTRYLDYLLSVIVINEERYLLLGKRKVLAIREDLPPAEDIFTTGVGKVSAEKGTPDYIYIVGQMLRFIDPSRLSTRLGVTDAELLQLLLKHKDTTHLLPCLVAATVRYNNGIWARLLLANKESSSIILLNALSANERIGFYEQFVETDALAVLPYLFDDDYTLMPLALGKKLTDHFAKNPYITTPQGYQQFALHLPYDMMPHLKAHAESLATEYQARYFKTQATEMMRVIEIKNCTK